MTGKAYLIFGRVAMGLGRTLSKAGSKIEGWKIGDARLLLG